MVSKLRQSLCKNILHTIHRQTASQCATPQGKELHSEYVKREAKSVDQTDIGKIRLVMLKHRSIVQEQVRMKVRWRNTANSNSQ